MQNEKDLMDIFKDANGDDPGSGSQGGNNSGGGDDDSGIAFKDTLGDDDGKGKGDGGDDGNGSAPGDAKLGDGDDADGADGGSAGDNNGDGGGDDGDNMPEVISSLFAAVMESSGIEDVDMPKTPEELIDKLSGIIKENSKPKYNSPISEELDAFIGDGGTIDEFILKYSGTMGLLPSIETEEEKISVIEEVLADAGFSKERIQKKIEKYLENDTLDDEAKDALGVLAEKRNAKMRELAENEKTAKIQREQAAAEFFKSVEAEISKINNIRGIKLTPAQSKELSEYCLKVDKKDGLTGFQRDYAKSPVLNFIESAFFTKYGTAMIKAAEGAGSSSAIEKFKSSLKNTKMAGNSRTNNQGQSAISDWVKLASAFSGRK